MVTFKKNGPPDATIHLLLAHGAGAGMDTPFMESMAQGLAKRGIRVYRFEFNYMQIMRETGKRRPPDRAPVMLDCFTEQIRHLRTTLKKNDKLVIGGKSMGGRMASLLLDTFEVDELDVDGLLCLGYPFHAVGKPDKSKYDHLLRLQTTGLIIQGDRDTMGNQPEVITYPLSETLSVHWLADGDHSFKPRIRSGRTLEQNLEEAISVAADFLFSLAP